MGAAADPSVRYHVPDDGHGRVAEQFRGFRREVGALLGFCALQRARPGPPPPPVAEIHVLPPLWPPPSAPIAESGVDEASLASFGGCSLSVAPPPGCSVNSHEKQSSGLQKGKRGLGRRGSDAALGRPPGPMQVFIFCLFMKGVCSWFSFSTASCQ